MGLDNIPHQYPCRTLGSAVLSDRLDKDGNTVLDELTGIPMKQIDCDATISAGGCPYTIAKEKAGIDKGAVYGIFGTPCWYRGKYGNYLLDKLDIYDSTDSFYGDHVDGTYKSPESCRFLADAIEEAMTEKNGSLIVDGEDLTDDVRYATWYLRWAADCTDGLSCWY